MKLAEAIAQVSGAILAVSAVMGLGVRWVLFPWLRDHLATPLLERLDLLAGRLEGLASDLSVASRMYDGHIEHSAQEAGRIWHAIHELRAAMPRRFRRHTTREDPDT